MVWRPSVAISAAFEERITMGPTLRAALGLRNADRPILFL